jgi:hypothetical protein
VYTGNLRFMMLDPNPKTQPTSRQLVELIHCEDSIYLKYIKRHARRKCSGAPMSHNNLPLHSIFKPDSKYSFPQPLEAVFVENFNDDWEAQSGVG